MQIPYLPLLYLLVIQFRGWVRIYEFVFIQSSVELGSCGGFSCFEKVEFIAL